MQRLVHRYDPRCRANRYGWHSFSDRCIRDASSLECGNRTGPRAVVIHVGLGYGRMVEALNASIRVWPLWPATAVHKESS